MASGLMILSVISVVRKQFPVGSSQIAVRQESAPAGGLPPLLRDRFERLDQLRQILVEDGPAGHADSYSTSASASASSRK